MNFEFSPKVQGLQQQLQAFMSEHVYPNEDTWHDQIEKGGRWEPTPIVEALKVRAKAAGLWNLFLPESEYGAGLTNLEYAPLCEIMGRSPLAPEVFNCSAPDTGNMEVLVRYGTPEQKRALAQAAAGRRDPLLLRHDRAGRRLFRRHQHPIPHRSPGRRLRHQRPQMVDLRRRRSALQDRHLHGQDRPGRAAPPAAVDDPGADGHARRHGQAHAHGLRLRRRPARPRRDPLRERPRAGGEPAAGRGPRLRDRPGPAGAGAHPSLHAPDRPGRAQPGSDVPARANPRRFRQAARRAGHHPGRHRRSRASRSNRRGC